MLTLYGSTTSPYVRRIRIILHSIAHSFVNLQIFSGPDRETLRNRNPALKVPMLVDGEQNVFDSRVIHRYLSQRFSWPALSWDDENQLTLIDAVNDSMVQMFLLSKTDVDTSVDKLYFTLQRERISTSLDALEALSKQGAFTQWHYPSICLFSMLDWGMFRELLSLDAYPGLTEVHQRFCQREDVKITDPRL